MSAATAVRLAAEHRDHGTAVPKPQGRPAGQFGKLAPHQDFLLEIVQAEPDITLKELAAALAESARPVKVLWCDVYCRCYAARAA